MFSGQHDNFGGPSGGEGMGLGSWSGTGSGAGDSGVGGPPPADAMFESMFDDGLDDLIEAERAKEPRESEVFAAGIHFFSGMRAMRSV